jgi:rare lipoprotein A
MPQGRPYSLGHTAEDMTASNRISEVSSRIRDRRSNQAVAAASSEDEEQPAPSVKPVAAYAPASRDGISNLMSARGLY